MERDKFLTEAMGGCWFEAADYPASQYICEKCGKDTLNHYNHVVTGSTWPGFGKLWEWAQQQEWWGDFCELNQFCTATDWHIIHPDRFSNAVYEFLKEREA